VGAPDAGRQRQACAERPLVDPSNSTYNLQIARVIQCALSPTRKIFTDAAELLDWLGPTVTDAERRELRTFLG
jgi:hypothetical protein